MKLMNEININFPSVSVNESLARCIIANFIFPLDPTIEELSDIKTAVSEAVTNCIVHAYKDTIGTIYINAKISDTGNITIKIRDKGKGITDIKQAMQPMFTTEADSERSGLGFAVMQSFMDTVKVTSKENIGTTVTMSKRIIRRTFYKNG